MATRSLLGVGYFLIDSGLRSGIVADSASSKLRKTSGSLSQGYMLLGDLATVIFSKIALFSRVLFMSMFSALNCPTAYSFDIIDVTSNLHN